MKSKIDLFDTSFILHSDENNEYIQSLAGYIRSKIDNIQEDVDTEDTLKQAILTLLLITHELKTTQKELETTNKYTVDSMKSLLLLLEEEKELETT